MTAAPARVATQCCVAHACSWAPPRHLPDARDKESRNGTAWKLAGKHLLRWSRSTLPPPAMKQGGAPPRQDADGQIQQRHCQAVGAGPVGMQMGQIACLLGRRAVAASAQVRLFFFAAVQCQHNASERAGAPRAVEPAPSVTSDDRGALEMHVGLSIGR